MISEFISRRKDAGPMFRFVFLCGNSTDGYNGHLKVFQFMHPLFFLLSLVNLL